MPVGGGLLVCTLLVNQSCGHQLAACPPRGCGWRCRPAGAGSRAPVLTLSWCPRSMMRNSAALLSSPRFTSTRPARQACDTHAGRRLLETARVPHACSCTRPSQAPSPPLPCNSPARRGRLPRQRRGGWTRGRGSPCAGAGSRRAGLELRESELVAALRGLAWGQAVSRENTVSTQTQRERPRSSTVQRLCTPRVLCGL